MTSGQQAADAAFDAQSVDTYLDRYLAEAPFAVALWRAAEASAMSQVELSHPILDIGCGFGEFGRIFFRDRPAPEVGVDIDRGELVRAAAASVYRAVVQCDGRRLPFADRALASVLAISTLEHIPDVAATFAEVRRVLQPGGVFVYTVPVDAFSRNMLGHRVLRAASARLADGYAGYVNRLLTHVNVWPALRWSALTDAGGLRVEQVVAFMSPRGTAVYEMLLPLALASRVWRLALGSRPPHPKAVRRLAARWLRPLIAGASPVGSNIMVVARKPA